MRTADKDVNMKATFAVMNQRSWVQIPYSPEFFSGLLFTTAQVVFITAKIAFIFIKCKGRKARESSIQIFLCFRFTKQEFSVNRNLSLRFNFLLKKYLKILSFNSSSFFFSFFFLERMGFLKKLLADKTRTPLLFVTFLLELAFYQKCFVSLG